MNCKRCHREDLPEGAKYCPWCGGKQSVAPRYRRGNGQGTAIRRGATWTARVVLGYKPVPVPEGEPPKQRAVYRTKGGFRTKRDALDYCTVLKQAGYRAPASAPQLIRYWETYADNDLPRLSKSKQVAYRGAWGKLKDLHWRTVDGIGVTDLRRAVTEVAPTYYTARDCKTVLTRLFELAGADGWCSKDLPSYIVLPALEEREREAFGDAEQGALWKLYEAGDLRAAIPLLMICTGMMPGEMQALKVEHIDLEERKIVGVGIKTKVRRKSAIYLPDDVLPVVEDLIAHAQPSGYLWARNEEKWYREYYAALEAAGCRRLEPYCCRHTTATRLAITEGIAPQTVRRMMRWSTARMLDRYAHPDDAAVRAAANTIRKPTPEPTPPAPPATPGPCYQ